MSMTTWAENEVRIACERERASSKTPEGEWDYGCACYESALNAYKSLIEEGHSGLSINITKNLLVRLIEGKPLTPIEDTEDVWEYVHDREDGSKVYQCRRMFSLFKQIYPDGKVEYRDVDYCFCVDLDNPNVSYRSSFVNSIIYEMFPITMPYIPPTIPYKVICETFLFDKENGGDFDTKGILYIITPDGERKDINRYFAETDEGFVEIEEKEYEARKLVANGWKQVAD